MPHDELRVDAARNLLQVTFPALGQEQGEEVDLEEEVAELVAQLLVVAALGGVRDLVGLLDRVRDDRPRRLLAVPGTVAPQPLGELLELEQRLAQRHVCETSRWCWSARPAARSRPGTSISFST